MGCYLSLIMGCLIGTSAFSLGVGDKLGDLSRFELEGEVPDLKGKVVLLDFWATWCGPCKESFPVMEKLQAEYGDQGFVVLAVSVDEKAKAVEKWLEKMKSNISIVRDGQHALVNEAGIETMPTTFFIDRQGLIRSTHNGFSRKHSEDIYRKELEALLAE